MTYNALSQKSDAFTLLEILIVVILLGVLAAIVIPQFVDQSEAVEQAAFFTSMKNIASAMNQFRAANGGAFPPDRNPAQCPAGFAPYLQMNWATEKPLGGQWDWDKGVFGVTAGISVYLPSKSATYMREIDSKFDDGNLNTGSFRARSQGYIYIIAR